MNFSDLSFLLIPDVALEADDITKQVNQIMGGQNAPADTKTDDQTDLGDDPGMSEEDKSIFSDKNTLKENMIYFFNIIRYTITSLEDGLGSTEDQETIRVVNSVIHNLYNSKDILYKILTEEMESTPYETLVVKYITLKRIYDISCDMLEEHFSNNPNSRVKSKRFNTKST